MWFHRFPCVKKPMLRYFVCKCILCINKDIALLLNGGHFGRHIGFWAIKTKRKNATLIFFQSLWYLLSKSSEVLLLPKKWHEAIFHDIRAYTSNKVGVLEIEMVQNWPSNTTSVSLPLTNTARQVNASQICGVPSFVGFLLGGRKLWRVCHRITRPSASVSWRWRVHMQKVHYKRSKRFWHTASRLLVSNKLNCVC